MIEDHPFQTHQMTHVICAVCGEHRNKHATAIEHPSERVDWSQWKYRVTE